MGVVVLGATAAAYFTFLRGNLTPWALLAALPVGFGWLCVMQAAANT
jgi:hypothetical protein